MRTEKMGKNNHKTYQLREIVKPENAEILKNLGKLENLEELELIMISDEKLCNYLMGCSFNLAGRCGKMLYIAMLTQENEEMTATQIRDLVNKVFDKQWSTRSVKSFLERLIIIKLVDARKVVFKTYYKLRSLEPKINKNKANERIKEALKYLD